MKKNTKKAVSIILSLFMLITGMNFSPFTVLAADIDSEAVGESSGSVGDCTWELSDRGVLTISGSGKIQSSPWGRNINEVIIQDGVTGIGFFVFSDCKNLSKITMPDSINSIDSDAFRGCTALTEFTIPNGVSSIEWGTFENCTNLSSITIPNSIVRIERDAFRGCENLSSVFIPESVTDISGNPFQGCTGITCISVDNNNTKYDSRNDCNSIIETSSNTIICGCNSTIIPNTITKIGDYAFSECTMTQIDFPQSITNIGYYAFQRCKNLTNINLPDTVTNISGGAFEQCESIISFDIPEGIETITGSMLSYCKNLTTVSVPQSVTKIDNSAFRECNKLSDINIPSGITSIGARAFDCCNNLSSFVLPENLTEIGAYAFCQCSGFAEIVIPESVNNIGNCAFSGCSGLISLSVNPNNMQFDSRENCNAIIETSSNKLICGSNSAFIPNSVTSIGEYAFDGCSLTNINIPDSVTTICSDAFKDCSKLSSLCIPASVTKIEHAAFLNCGSLNEIVVDSANTKYDSRNNCNALIDKSSDTLLRGSNNTIIPSNINVIGSYAFSGCNQMTGITIPSNITTIYYCAFKDCTNLEGIVIPNSVTYFADQEFQGCTNLKAVVLPDGLGIISDSTFRDCINLQRVAIPDSINRISTYAFYNCPELKGIYYKGSQSQWESIEVWSCNDDLSNVTVYYDYEFDDPSEIIDDSYFTNPYEGDSTPIPAENSSDIIAGNCGEGDVWSGDFGNNNGSKYGDNVQWRLNKATGLLEIFGTGEMGSFWVLEIYQPWKPYQSIIKDVIVYEGVSKIGDGAFAFCGNIQTIYLPSTMTSVGSYAFYGNDSLNTVYFGGRKKNYVGPNINVKYNSQKRYWDYSQSPLYIKSSQVLGIDISFKSEWFKHDSGTYDHNIARFCSLIIMAGYQKGTPDDIKNTLRSLNFSVEDNYVNLDTGRDEVNYFIASREINQNGEKYNLVFIGCIGSNDFQWNSDFDPNGVDSKTNYDNTADYQKGNQHRGFNDAKYFIFTRLNSYLEDKQYDRERTKFLVTGHSRGAATANLISAELIDGNDYVMPQNLFTYTFATPNNTTNPNRGSGIYNRIFNIVNPTDFVTKAMPSAWGWGRYGTTYSLPAKTNDNNYSALKNKMMGYYRVLNKATKGNETYYDYLGGEKEVYYVVKALTSSVHNVDEFYNKKLIYSGRMTDPMTHLSGSKRLSTFEYFDKSLCQIANEKGDRVLGFSVLATPLTSDSFLFKSLSGFFSISGLTFFADAHKMETYCSYIMGLNSDEIVANRTGYRGSINCPVDVEIYDKESNELVGQVLNNSVNEEIAAKENSVVIDVNGDEKLFWLPSNGDYDVRFIGNDTGAMDYSVETVDSDLGEISRQNYNNIALEPNKIYAQSYDTDSPDIDSNKLKDEEGVIIEADESFIIDEKQTYDVTIDTEGSGVANDSLTVISGDYVTVSAEPVGSYFLGWYYSDNLLSQDIQYRFRPNEDIEITAKFSGLIGDANTDGYLNINDVTAIQRYLCELEALTGEQIDLADTNCDETIDIADATLIQMFLAEYDVVLGKQN